jgi:hypothetical protein
MTPDDAVAVARCTYAVYGYTLPNDYLYFPERLRELLAGPGRHSRTPEVAARCVAVLSELGLCEWRPDRTNPALGVLSSKETKLERSRAYVACAARHTEGLRYLRARAQLSG